MAIMHFLPKFTKVIPSGLAAIVIVTLIVVFVPGLGDVANVASYLEGKGASELT